VESCAVRVSGLRAENFAATLDRGQTCLHHQARCPNNSKTRFDGGPSGGHGSLAHQHGGSADDSFIETTCALSSEGRAGRVFTDAVKGSRPLGRSIELHHYVVARTDVPVGVMSAQIVHAAGESSDRVASGTHAVCLGVEDESELLELELRLLRRGIPHAAIREPDAPWCGALMAIGLEPAQRDKKIRKEMSKYKLIGEEKK